MSYDPSGHPPPHSQPQGWQQPPPVVSGPPGQPYGVPQQPWPPPQQFYPGQAPPPPKKYSKTTLIVGAVSAVLLLAAVVGAAANAGRKAKTEASGATTSTAKAEPADKTEPDEPAEQADDAKTFNTPVGATITVTDDGSVTEATLRSVKTFSKGCNSLNVDPENGLYVVFDVVVQQTKGAGSVNPLNFEFVGDDGTSANSIGGAFSGCDEPSLTSTNSLRAGQKRAGKMAFDTSSKKGALEWAPGGIGSDTVGSWKTS